MKLKKIASLALAGIMAVSMLAGCSNGNNGGNNGNGNGNGNVTPVTSKIVDAVNDGQTAGNKVKVEFKVNSKLDAALQQAVNVYGTDARPDEVFEAITVNTGLEEKSATLNNKNEYGFLTGGVTYQTAVNKKQDADGDTYTFMGVVKVTALSEDYVLNSVAKAVDQAVATLSVSSDDKDGNGKVDVAVDKKYYGYDYDGSISMVSVETLDGTTAYYVAYVVNQTVTTKTL